MAETKISKNQTGSGIFTTASLIGGRNVTITQKDEPIIDANTVGLYHLDGSLKDEISGQDGSFYWLNPANPRTPTYDDGGQFGKCIKTTGIEQILQFVNSSSGTYTVDFWLKRLNTSETILILNTDDAYYPVPRLRFQNNQFSIGNKLSGTGSDTGTLSYPTGIEFTENVWKHVAYVLDGANSMVYLFLDGNMIYSATKTGSVADASCVGVKMYDQVCIDEIRLSNVARWTSDFTPYDMPYSAGGDPLYEVSADVNGALTSIQGYNANETQVLWNNMGTLMWVTTTYQGGD